MTARLTPHEVALRAILERDWQATVETLARAHGWKTYHPPDNRPVTSRSGSRYVQNIRAGFPDLVLVRGPRLVAAELKRETEHPTPDQVAWLTALREAGAETYVWRPSDLTTVRTILRRPS